MVRVILDTEAPDPVLGADPMGHTLINQPVQHPIQSDAITHIRQLLLQFVVRQRSGGSKQSGQHSSTRPGDTGTMATKVISGPQVKIRGIFHGLHCSKAGRQMQQSGKTSRLLAQILLVLSQRPNKHSITRDNRGNHMATVHVLQHLPFEDLGAIEPWLHEHGHQIRTTHLYRGELPGDPDSVDWLIIMGGAMGVHDEQEYQWLVAEKAFIRHCINNGKTVLGVCLGAQLIADVLGASVTRNAQPEIGWFPISACHDHELARLFADSPHVLHWHGDTFAIPAGAMHLCRSEACENQAFVYGDRIVGLQFHLEATADSVRELCEGSADELQPSAWVQDATTLQSNAAHFDDNNERLASLLSWLAQRLPNTP